MINLMFYLSELLSQLDDTNGPKQDEEFLRW